MSSPNKPGVLRKLGLATALLVTAVLSWPGEDGETEVVDVVVPVRGQAVKSSGPAMAVDAVVGPAELDDEALDPFAIREWQSAPGPEVVPQPPQNRNVATVEIPAGPVVPSLPYRYVGRLSDGGIEVVYLARGDESVLARMDETLDATYKVVAISPQSVEFVHLPTGERQSITITPVSN